MYSGNAGVAKYWMQWRHSKLLIFIHYVADFHMIFRHISCFFRSIFASQTSNFRHQIIIRQQLPSLLQQFIIMLNSFQHSALIRNMHVEKWILK